MNAETEPERGAWILSYVRVLKIVVIGIVVVLLALFAWARVQNLEARDNPPVACQLLGGSWSLWSGWSCG